MVAKRKISDAFAIAVLKRRFGKVKEFTIEDIRGVYHVELGSPYARRLITQKYVRHVGRNRYKLLNGK